MAHDTFSPHSIQLPQEVRCLDGGPSFGRCLADATVVAHLGDEPNDILLDIVSQRISRDILLVRVRLRHVDRGFGGPHARGRYNPAIVDSGERIKG